MSDIKLKSCLVDQKQVPIDQGTFLKDVDSRIVGHIDQDHKNVNDSSFICNQHLLNYQIDYINQLMDNDKKKNDKIDAKLTKSIDESNYQINNINDALNENETIGEKLSDLVAKFGGTWTFIIVFLSFLTIWILINTFHIFGLHFDTFPFILLNLALSILAALQSPIIMMSQNRASHRDHLNADNDYHVNLKSESELRSLHAKLDHISKGQLPNNMETQRLQVVLLGEVRKELESIQNERMEDQELLQKIYDKLNDKN